DRRRQRRRRRGLPRVRAHRRHGRRRRRGGPGAGARRSLPAVPQPPAAADAGQRLDRRPGARPARAVLAGAAAPVPAPDEPGAGPYRTGRGTTGGVEPAAHFRFVPRPLSRYVNAMAQCGLLVERMVEPAPPPGFLALAPEYPDAATVPRLLYLRAVRHDR